MIELDQHIELYAAVSACLLFGATPDEIETAVSEILIDLHEEQTDATPDHQDDPQGAEDPARDQGR